MTGRHILIYKNCDNVCVSNASGSVGPNATLLSDYDLTITGHFQISKIITIFNTIINNIFYLSSNDALDTNLYGYSFLILRNTSDINTNIWSIDSFKEYYEIRTDSFISEEQDKWAYLRLYTLLKQYNIINFNIKEYNEFGNKNSLNKRSTEKSKNYITKMIEFENLTNDKTNNDKNKIIDALSFMNYYGEDTYFTQGAFTHVVGTMFYYKNKSIDETNLYLKKYYIIHSLIENAAYFIDSYNTKLNTTNINEVLIYASKYLQRFINGLLLLFKNDILEKLLDQCNNIKTNIRNKSDTELKLYIESLEEYTNKDIKINNFKKLKVDDINKSLVDIIYEFKLYKPIDDINFYINAVLILLKYTLDQYKDNTTLTITYENNKFSINKY